MPALILAAAVQALAGPPGDYGDAPVGDLGAGIEAYPGVVARWTTLFSPPNAVASPVQQPNGTWLAPGGGACLGSVFPSVKMDSLLNPSLPDNDAEPVVLIEVLGPNPLAEMRVRVTFDPANPSAQEAYLNVFIDQNRDGQWKDGYQVATPVAAWTPEWCQVNEKVIRPAGTNVMDVILKPFRMEAPQSDVWVRILVSDAPLPPFTGGWPWDGTMPAVHGRAGEIEDHLLRFSPAYRPGSGIFVKREWLAGGGGGGAGGGKGGPGGPCGGGEQYDVSHRFTLRPGGNQMPAVWGNFLCHAWLLEERPDCAQSVVWPPQGAGFRNYGTNTLGAGVAVQNAIGGGAAAPATIGDHRLPVPVPAPEYLGAESVIANACAGCSTANSEWAVRPFVAGGVISGTIRSWGQARAGRGPRDATAYAYSMTAISARGSSLRKGTIVWEPVVHDIVGGGARQQRDPIEFVVTDKSSGVVHRGRLLSIDMRVLPQSVGGGFTWENGVLSISASDMDFDISMPGNWTTVEGEFHVQVRAGVVASAWASGQYAGMEPKSGLAVPLKIPVPTRIEFDYDLGGLVAGGVDAEYELNLYGAGEARDRAGWEEVQAAPVPGAPAADPEMDVRWPAAGGTADVPEWRLVAAPAIQSPAWAPVRAETRVVDGWNRVRLPAVHDAGFLRLERVEPDRCALRITRQPETVRVTSTTGPGVTFQVVVEGMPAPSQYQWQRSHDGGPFTDVGGLFGPLITVAPGPDDGGDRYRCRISNGCTVVDSAPAELVWAVKEGITAVGDLPPEIRRKYDLYVVKRAGVQSLSHEAALREIWPGAPGMRTEWGDTFRRLYESTGSN